MKHEQKTELVLRRGLIRPRPGVLFVLKEDFVVGDWTVPVGFETDLGSIPIGARNIVQNTDAIEAFVLHDWHYYTGDMSRVEADDVLNEMLKAQQMVRWKRFLIYRGVRIGGWAAWNKHRARP